MVRKTVWTLLAVVGMVAGLAWVDRAVSSPMQEVSKPTYKPVSQVQFLMEGQKMHFKAAAGMVKNKNAEERYEHIQMNAEVLAELANVNTYNKDKEDYRRWAAQVRDLALKLSAEAGKESKADENTMRKILTEINDTCVSCHDVYQ